jgi:WD40 repeat protein/DNA-binding SARP family transcriptional activator
MEIRVLGPLEVLAAGSPLNLGGKQRRTLFAILAVNAGRSVSTHQLIDELWGDSPPEAARKSVQAHVAHLRKTLNTDREALSSTNGGYVIEFEPDALDINRFERLFEEGRRLQQTDPRGAVEKLDQALGLFRGAPLAGLADEAHSLRVEASKLEELRSAAIEERLGAQIRSGDPAGAAAEAERLVAEFPLRERLWSLLMLSLYLSGRQGEALRAFSRARQALAEELGIEPSAELRDLEQRILDQDPSLDDPESGIATEPTLVAGAVRNPYKGLRPFDEADAADFFGRDGLIRRLLERVEDRTSSSLVVLAGPSGAGKSSAVRAGLIPKLRDRGNAVAVMFPGADPMAALAKTITEITGDSPAEILEQLGSGDPVHIDGILIVDQLEEIFTMARSAEDVDRFLKVVTGAESSIRSVVATIRADFLNHLLAHPRTGAILEEALVLVPPLQSHEIEAAVVGPAERIGLSVEPELMQRIVTDVQTKSAALPLLQFALTDCFERRRDDSLSIADYERAGGITGALARRADQLYEALDPEHQHGARQLFLHLVSITDDEERIRRRVTWKTLLSLGNDPDVMSKVIERFGSQRLLTFDQDSETGEATVEVAHEALIAEWPTLASWVDAARDDLRMRQRLLAARREWEESSGDESFLLKGSRLAEMEAWRDVSDVDLPETAMLFLEKSRQVEDGEATRRSRRRRSIVATLVAAGLVASVLASIAISQQTAAEEQARILLAGDLASAANVNLDVDPELSILLALEAVATTQSADGTVLRVAEEALHRAVMSHRLLDRIRHEGEGIAHFSPDGMSFLSSGEDENVVDVWSVESLERKLTLTGHTDVVNDAVFDLSGDRIATTSNDGTVRVWDAASGRSEAVFPVGGSPKVPAFSNDGRLLAATADTTTWMWDLESEEEIWVADPPGGYPINLAFSPDDSLLAVTRAGDGEVNDVSAIVYDVNTGGSVRTLEGHDAQDVGFTPDGSRVLTAGADGTVRIWDAGSGEHLDTYTGHRGSVSDLQISADGTMVASSGAVDVLVWDLSTLELEAELFGHTGEVWAIDLNLDAELLLTATKADRTTRLWDLSPYWSHELLGLPGSSGCVGCAFPSVAAGLAYSPDGATLATSGEAGLVNVWDAITGAERHAIQTAGPLYRLDIDPGSSFLATAGPAGAELHDINSGESVATLVAGVETLDAEFGPNGLLATASFDGVRLWESLRGSSELIYDLNGVFSVAFDPSGTVLAMSIVEESLKGFIEIRDLGSGETIATLTEHSPNIVKELTFDSTGDLLATASDDTTAIIWDTATFEPVHQLEGHGTAVVSADFDPSRPEVATAGLDGTVKIWNVETGNLRLTLPAQGALSDIGYSPDGRYLAATGPNGFVTVYMLDLDELVAEAESRLTRWWSESECLQYLQTEECPPIPEGLHP